MRTFLPFILALAAAPLMAGDVRSDAVEAEKLLQELPRQSVLSAARDLIVGNVFPEPARGKATPEEKEEARLAIETAKTIVPKLRKLLVTGRSVFDYPGLLSRGTITWSGSEYDLYLGVYLRRDQGQGIYDFRLTFDAKGKILAVEDVIWKH